MNGGPHDVVLYRANGRYVKRFTARSKYAAKKLKQLLDDRYDEAYYLKVEPTSYSPPPEENSDQAQNDPGAEP